MSHKIQDILVGDKLMELWSREETHEWGCLNNWWLKFQDNWIPWTDKGTNRVSWGLELKTGNRIKFKWNDYDIRKTGQCNILCNNRVVYSFNGSDVDYLIPKAHNLIHTLQEHPFNFPNPASEIGRKIWYYNQPGIVDRLVLDQGCIMIKHAEGKGFDLKEAWKEHDEDAIPNEWDGQIEIKDNILTDKIWWFRK